MADQALDRPGRGVAKRADGMAFNLRGHFQQHVDLVRFGITRHQPFHHAPHPAGAFAARRALAAAFMLVEVRQAGNGAHDVGGLVHHNHRCGAQAGFQIAQTVEIHRRFHDLVRRHQRHRRTTRDHRQQIVPPAADAAAMRVDQFTERQAHGFFHHAGPVHMAADLEQLGAFILGPTDGGEPFRATAQDGRHHGDGFDIVHRRRVAIQASAGRERRLQARLALLAFQAFDHRGFFAADIRAAAAMDDDIEIITGAAGVLADQAGGIGLLHGGHQHLGFGDIFAADIDEGRPRAHGKAGDQRAFDQLVRIMADDLAILARTRFGFVGVDDQIARPIRVRRLRHEAPLHAGREPRAAATAQAAGLHRVDQPIGANAHQILGVGPIAACARSFKVPRLEAIEVGEDAILVGQHHTISCNVVGPASGHEAVRPIWLPTLGSSPRASMSRISLMLSNVRSS